MDTPLKIKLGAVVAVAFLIFGTVGAVGPVGVTCGVPQLPVPPSTAVYFTNVQNNTGVGTPWSATDTGTGTTGSGSYTMTFGNSSPSLSGASMMVQNVTTTTTHNVLAVRKFGCTAFPGGVCTWPNNVETDFWVYIVPGSTASALEFDPDLYGPNIDFFMSMQYRITPTGQAGLYLYSKLGSTWINANNTPLFPLAALSQGVWHHIQTYGTFSRTTSGSYPNGSYTYIDLIVDNTYVYHNLNLTEGAGSDTSTGNTEIEFQTDDATTAGTITEYQDKITAVFWQ